MADSTRPCATCGAPIPGVKAGRGVVYRKYCGDQCKPRCTVDGCENPQRKRTWCAAHYAQSWASGLPPKPFVRKWEASRRCHACGAGHNTPGRRKYCSDKCQQLARRHPGGVPTTAVCVLCKVEIDLTVIGKGGRRRYHTVKLCRRCKTAGRKHGMTPGQLALRDGFDCGICRTPVDFRLVAPDPYRPSVDHILPRACGGSNDPSNLQLAHLHCNQVKSDRITAT